MKSIAISCHFNLSISFYSFKQIYGRSSSPPGHGAKQLTNCRTLTLPRQGQITLGLHCRESGSAAPVWLMSQWLRTNHTASLDGSSDLNYFSVCIYLVSPSVWHCVWSAGMRPCSRLTQGDVAHGDDPEAGSSERKPPSRHFYPIALLLVSSHLLVVWLILSLVFLLAKYQ